MSTLALRLSSSQFLIFVEYSDFSGFNSTYFLFHHRLLPALYPIILRTGKANLPFTTFFLMLKNNYKRKINLHNDKDFKISIV